MLGRTGTYSLSTGLPPSGAAAAAAANPTGLSSTGRGVGGVPGAAGRAPGLYSFDASELDMYSLPKLRPAGGISGASGGGGGGGGGAAGAGLAGTGSLLLGGGSTVAGGSAVAGGAVSGRTGPGGTTARITPRGSTVGVPAAATGGGDYPVGLPGAAGTDVTGPSAAVVALGATYAMVRDAIMGDADETKCKEADDYALMLLAPAAVTATAPPPVAATAPGSGGGGGGEAVGGRRAGAAAGGVKPPPGSLAATHGLTGGDVLATTALMEVDHLKSGEDAIAFFMKYGPACPVKFVYLKRKFSPASDVYRPYDLLVVPPKAAGEDHFVMSAKGVVHIEPGEPSEFHSLSDWMRDASAFNVCTAMRFFRYYLPRKVFGTWRANVRFNRYCKQRAAVRGGLFSWKPAFAAALVEIFAALSQLERVPLLHLSAPRYTIASFLDAQAATRADAVKVAEKQLAAIQAAIERVCADVVKRARAHDEDEDDDGGDGGGGGGGGGGRRDAPKIKSMAAARAEAARKAAALRAAGEEEAVLGAFVRLVDYMTVETTARLVISQVEAFLRDITTPEARRIAAVGADNRAGGGMFMTAVRFEAGGGGGAGSGGGTLFEPAQDEFLAMAESVITEAVKTATSTPRILYARAFREYVQELPTEAGPGNLAAPTVASLLAISPEFHRIKGALEDKFRADFAAASAYVAIFDAVRPIYDYNATMDFEAYRTREHTTYTLQRDMSRIKQWDLQLATMRMQDSRGCLFIDSKRLKQELEPVTVSAMDKIKALLLELARDRCRRSCDAFKARTKMLAAQPAALDKFAGHVERVAGIKEVEAAMAKDAASVEDMYKLLQSYEVKISYEESVALDDMKNAVAEFAEAMRASDAFLEARMPEMTRQLDVSIIKVTDSLKALADGVNEGVYLDASAAPADVLAALEGVRAKLAAGEEQVKRFNRWQALFGIASIEFKQLGVAHKAYAARHAVWAALADFGAKYTHWTTAPLVEVDMEEVGRDVAVMQKTAFMLDKSLGDAVSASLKAKVGDFRQYVGVITDLGNRAMRDRHWKKLYEECGQPWYGNNPDRTLLDLMAFNVFEYPDLVAEVSGTASGEAQLEGSLAKIVAAWGATNFTTKPYREQKHVYILGALEDVMTQLEDHQVLLQTMMGSRYITGVREQVEVWDRKLSLLSETLDEWITCQKQWMYLETIFSAEDIQRQLPAEASKFSTVDKRWKDIMFRTHATPLVVGAVDHGEELLRAFQTCNAALEAIQKSLEDYLETKRAAFPRFYFLSNDDLLAILSQTRDPQAVQPHLMKCFDNIKAIDFGAGANAHEMFAMTAGDGERVEWSAPVAAEGNVEDWLCDVEAMMRTSLYDHAKGALAAYPPYEAAIDRRAWFFTRPAQAIILVDQIMWTAGAAAAIREVAAGRQPGALAAFLDYNKRQIEAMVAMVRGDLTRQQRTLLGAMVVIDVHARDVVAAMVRKGVSSLEDFEWTKQLRYYWEADVDNCVVRQTNTRFVYGYEYLGNSERLVITPLTDACYMTLTGALHLKFGGAPQGPAGTGKTETTKDLAKALGMQCVVFNCSDGLDALIMARFFAGLAQAGAWSCFDEFNRIDIEVLSVIAQQILVIQQGLVTKASHIMFEGREIPLSPAFGVFITMNPGYAGRTELPDNLKALFRPVAMMVPDYRLIAEIILFSQGFADALNLSFKMVQLYKLASEQLSKQDHYDFGMRAVKSVLVAAGQLKRKEPEVDENILLIRAMRDSNVPKFLEHDLPLFRGILSDLFPGVEVPFVDYGRLQTAIEDAMELGGLQRVPALITKIIQTHETQLVRHGMMIVGEAGSGKSVNHETLAKALTALKRDGVVDKDGFYQHVQRFILNPKAVTMGELYGEFNLVTQEWRDGLVATLVHEAVADTSPSRKWIVFDGPVDALWIENMNTVLDDNKMLCLANGERIKLPPTMHMMFEVRDLAVASPATVSRCGMVYMEPVHVGVLPLVTTWAAGEVDDYLPEHRARLAALLADHVPKALRYLRTACREVVPSQDMNLTASFLNLLLALLKPEAGVKGPHGQYAVPRTAAAKARERWAKSHGTTTLAMAEHGGAGGGGGAGGDGSDADDEEGEGEGAKAGEGGAAAAAAGGGGGGGAAGGTTDGGSSVLGEDEVGGGVTAEELEAEMEAEEASHADARPKARKGKGVLEPAHLERVINLAYVFAFTWSFGCNLHDDSRAKFNAFAVDLLRDLLPPSGEGGGDGGDADGGASGHASHETTDLFASYVDVEGGALRDWHSRVASFTYVPGTPYFNILVPTVDTTRYGVVFEMLLRSGRNVLFSGETGVGKSVIIADTLARLTAGDAATFASATINFSAQTQSSNLQEALESNLDKKRKNLLGPPAGKRMCIFVDDLNMPAKEVYGAQGPIELLRQVIDQGGFYDRTKLFFKHVANVVFAAAAAPPGGGRSEVTTRLTRQYHMVWLPSLSVESMTSIFDAILGGFLAAEVPPLASYSRPVVAASVDMYKRVEADLLPTPSKSHYTFNLRDLSKVFQGMLMVAAPQLPDKDALLRLWVHEVSRVFRDRLINGEDRDWFNALTASLLQSRLGVEWPVAALEGILFGDYLVKGDAERPYQRVRNPAALDALFTEYLDEYNVSFPTTMNLVFFRDAIGHVSRIARVLRQPRGNALLVGVGGSGRRSLTRLAAFMAEFQCSTIEITRVYGVAEWHEDLKRLLMAAGVKGKNVVFVFADTQIVKESFLEDLNNILNSGDVPNLYAPDEVEAILGGVRAAAKAAGVVETRANLFAYYVQQVRERFHIALCMSPIGAAFRTRCRQFPSLVNCCTIDWFNAWPEDALFSVARSFLADTALALGPLVDPLCTTCVRIHQSVEAASGRYRAEQRRHNYTTPTSYLELLRLYTGMLTTQRDVVAKKVARYRGGLTKLASTNEMVADLQAKLKDMQPVLAKAAADTSALLEQLAVDQKQADEAAEVAAKDEAETAEVAKHVASIKDECQADLDEALPAYYAAVKALKSLDKKQIQEVKSFTSPPKLVGVVLEAVCILNGKEPSWEEAKKLMNQMNFLETLSTFDKDNIAPRVIARLQKYVKDPEFTPEVVARVSSAATSLCLWVHAIVKYNQVATTIAPKKAALAEAEGKLAAAQAVLAEKRAALATILARLAELKASYTASLARRDELDAQSKMTALRLERAHKLIDGLGDEAVRWSAAAAQLEADMTNLVGNMVVASGCVAYIGPFTAGFRADLVRDWVATAASRDIPVDPGFSLTRLLADPVTVREWNIMGLPADDFSTENGLFASMGRRWPLMVDPQGQANRWIKNVHRDNALQVIKLTQSDFLRTLENAIRFGQPVLLENVEETLDPALEPVLLKQTFKRAGQILLRLGDNDVPYSDDFRFYITTKLANPHYMPEVCIKVTVINFTVTLRGLEDQLLVDVVRHERPDLEQKKDALIVSIAADKRALKEIEDKILQMLADSKGDILDDEGLINSLAASKTTSRAINDRMREAEQTTQEISEARESYRPVATRGSILYFVVADLANVDSMYQYSLPAFSRLYNLRIARSPKADTVPARVALLIDDLTRSFYGNVCRGLFEVHKLLYAFLIGVQVLRASGGITPEEWSFFMVGGAGGGEGGGGGGGGGGHGGLPPTVKGWLGHKAWAAAGGLEALPAFAGLTADLTANVGGGWATWMHSKKPAVEALPGRWNTVVGGGAATAGGGDGGGGGGAAGAHAGAHAGAGRGLTPFQRLLLLRALREEKTVQGVREFVRAELGAAFCEAPPFDLESTFADSTATTPIIFVLSPGADPIDSLLKLAKAKGKSGPSFRIISLGQGQGVVAERMMESARRAGDWVCLQNCHLAVSWLPKMEALLEAAAGAGGEHPDYRLWLTSMPSQRFPVSVLQNSIKVTNEPPRGIKANLMRTYLDLTDKEYDSCRKSREYKKLLFGLAFYHALVLERRKFGAIGWNISYDFANSDLRTGTMQLRMYLEEQPGVPFETLNNVVGDITYGGRVTDKWDKRTNVCLLARYYNAGILEDGFAFSESGVYYAPPAGPLAEVRAYVEGLPLEDNPEVFGLHENADINLQLKETTELMETIILMQPRSGGGGSGGKSSDDVVLDMVADITKRLPPAFNREAAHPATFARIEDGSINSLGVFLEQEVVRFNKLLSVMRSSLGQLHKAVKGIVVMSGALETMYSAFLFQRVPPEWEAAAYPSLKPLGSWIDDLVARLAAVQAWLTAGPPPVFWISGFFFPQGFMTGALQTHARKTRLAIDTLDFRTEVMPFTEAEVRSPPANGVYMYGLYLEGARWDGAARRMAEMRPGELFDRLPCVWLEPVLIAALDTSGTYHCPFYKTSKRAGVLTTTGHSSNFVMTMYLPTDQPQEHWVRRGVALLSMLDD